MNKKGANQLKFNFVNNSKKYKIGKIENSKVYAKKLNINYLLKLYYLVF